MKKMFQLALRRSISAVSRPLIQKNVLVKPVQNTGRRFVTGGTAQADISTLEAVLYLVAGGGGIACFGMYKTIQMRDRIEAYETGQVIPYEGPSDNEIIQFKEEIKQLQGDDE